MTTPTSTSTDLPALRAAVLARVERHLNTLSEDDLKAAIIQTTDRRTVEALAGATPPPTISEALRSLPTSDPYAILGDLIRTGGGVVPPVNCAAEYSFCITLPDGRRVVPRCLTDWDGMVLAWVDSLWVVARIKGWSPIRFFIWFTSPNPRLPLDATPRRYLEAKWREPNSVETVRAALLAYGEMGG